MRIQRSILLGFRLAIDVDPEHLATNSEIMHGRCEKLFTLAIVVSPLHNSEDRVFNKKSVSKDMLQLWEPLCDSLEDLRRTRVRVWEGEGPGFERPKVENTTV